MKGLVLGILAIAGCVTAIYYAKYTVKRTQVTGYSLARETVLVLMVRNEEAVIKRILSSAMGVLANHLILCDTGSNDTTIDLARLTWIDDGAQTVGTKRRLIITDWDGTIRLFSYKFIGNFTNFEDMRNTCKDYASSVFRSGALWNEIKWVALADADFTVSPRSLQEPSYQVNTIQVHAGSFGHPHNSLNLLISANTFSRHCTYRLWTHEYLECKQGSVGHYDGFYYVDFCDGKSRPDKLTRDIALLARWLEEKNETDLRSRALYYLARAHEDSGHLEIALKYYERHNKEQTFTNYAFYGRYRMALVHLKLNHTFEVVETAFLDAVSEFDGYFRREPLYYLARLSRSMGFINKCIMYGTAGVHAPIIDHSRMPLFLEPVIYDWALMEETGWCLSLRGRKREALQHFKAILEANPVSLDPDSRARIEKYSVA